MAGSYEHLIPTEDSDGGWSLIENMGDAYECVEELFWLVERGIGREKALQLLEREFYPQSREEAEKDEHRRFVESKMLSSPSECSKLGRLGAERHADLMAFLPDFEKSLDRQTTAAEEKFDDGDWGSDVKLTVSQARWVLSCMAFVATLPKYLSD